MSAMTRTRSSWARLVPAVALVATLAVSATPQAGAAVITNFSGNTRMAFPGNVDGTASFLVANRAGGTTADPFGLGIPLATLQAAFTPGGFVGGGVSGPLDLNAQFIYLFQTANDGGNALAISQSTTQINPGAVTSFGNLPGFGFRDAEGNVAPGQPLGTNGPFTGLNPAPANLDGQLPFTVVQNSAVITQSTGTAANPGPGVLIDVAARSFLRRWDLNGGLLNNQIGSLAVYTSNLGPAFGFGSIIDGGTSAVGTEIINIPEPSSIVMAGVGLVGLAGLGVRRLRNRAR